MNSLEGIIAANRNADKTLALARATNNPAGERDRIEAERKAIKRATARAKQNLQPKRDASGRLAR